MKKPTKTAPMILFATTLLLGVNQVASKDPDCTGVSGSCDKDCDQKKGGFKCKSFGALNAVPTSPKTKLTSISNGVGCAVRFDAVWVGGGFEPDTTPEPDFAPPVHPPILPKYSCEGDNGGACGPGSMSLCTEVTTE